MSKDIRIFLIILLIGIIFYGNIVLNWNLNIKFLLLSLLCGLIMQILYCVAYILPINRIISTIISSLIISLVIKSDFLEIYLLINFFGVSFHHFIKHNNFKISNPAILGIMFGSIFFGRFDIRYNIWDINLIIIFTLYILLLFWMSWNKKIFISALYFIFFISYYYIFLIDIKEAQNIESIIGFLLFKSLILLNDPVAIPNSNKGHLIFVSIVIFLDLFFCFINSISIDLRLDPFITPIFLGYLLVPIINKLSLGKNFEWNQITVRKLNHN